MIKVSLTFKQGCIASVQLSLSPVFSLLFTDAPQKDKHVLSKWLHEYFEGSKEPYREKLPLQHLSPFQQKVLQQLQQIPSGKTFSYSGLASAIGQPKAARAIGGACHINPFPLLIPCHRIIRADGNMGGFALDLEIKKRLLDFERQIGAVPKKKAI